LAFAVAVALALALVFLSVIPQGSASALAFAVACFTGLAWGFSPTNSTTNQTGFSPGPSFRTTAEHRAHTIRFAKGTASAVP
jgi:hypothetical protein